MDVTIIEEKGTHLLIARGDRFAIIERRNNRLYNCHSSKRHGIAADELSVITEIVDEADWVDEAVARKELDELRSRGTDLAERMW